MDSDLLALLNHGVEEATNGSKSRARTYFRHATSIDPDNETALLWLAWLSDDAYEAVELLEKVLIRNPRNDIARSYLDQAKKGERNLSFWYLVLIRLTFGTV